MGRKICIVIFSSFILISIALSQQTVKIGDFEFTLGGDIRTLYTSYMYVAQYGGQYINEQAFLPEVARLSLSGKYGEHLNAYFEGGYLNGWNYEHNWEEGYYFVRTTEWFYLGYMDLNLGPFGVSGGLNFVPTGIEPTTRDVDLHFLKPSVATLLLTPMRKPGINFRFTPFRFGERDFMSLSFGLYNDIYPLLDHDNQFDGFDRRFLLDLPYMASLTMEPLEFVKITGYYGREIA